MTLYTDGISLSENSTLNIKPVFSGLIKIVHRTEKILRR